MALRTCRDCNSPISTSAKACPKCGAKPPKTGIGCTGILVLLAGCMFVFAAFETPRGTSGSTTTNAALPKKPPTTPFNPKELMLFGIKASGIKSTYTDIKADPTVEEAKKVVAYGINLNGYACAEVKQILRSTEARSSYDVTCKELRDKNHTVKYQINPYQGTAKKI